MGDFYMEVLDKVRSTMRKYQLIRSDELVLVAVSGGADSLALLEILFQLQPEFGYHLHVIHLNHQLRPEAKVEAEFVKSYAEKRSIPTTILSRDIATMRVDGGQSLQELAREVRYQLFTAEATKIGAEKIALGHHADDLAETVLMRFLRGSGLEGLVGFTVKSRGNLIRPLISLTKEEILAFCLDQGLTPTNDLSNTKSIYFRNRLRLELIPQLEEEYNPQLRQHLVQFSTLVQQENSFIEEYANQAFLEVLLRAEEKVLVFDLNALMKKNPVLIRRIIRLGIEKLKGDRKNFYYYHYLQIQNLILAGLPGKMLHLPDDYLLWRGYQKLKLGKKAELLSQSRFLESYVLHIPGQIYLQELDLLMTAELVTGSVIATGTEVAVDADLLGEKLLIRSRRPGDRFIPLGMSGHKKVKDFLIDQKVERFERDLMPIVTTAQGEIIWLVGYRLDERFKVSQQTKRTCILRIKGGLLDAK